MSTIRKFKYDYVDGKRRVIERTEEVSAWYYISGAIEVLAVCGIVAFIIYLSCA